MDNPEDLCQFGFILRASHALLSRQRIATDPVRIQANIFREETDSSAKANRANVRGFTVFVFERVPRPLSLMWPSTRYFRYKCRLLRKERVCVRWCRCTVANNNDPFFHHEDLGMDGQFHAVGGMRHRHALWTVRRGNVCTTPVSPVHPTTFSNDMFRMSLHQGRLLPNPCLVLLILQPNPFANELWSRVSLAFLVHQASSWFPSRFGFPTRATLPPIPVEKKLPRPPPSPAPRFPPRRVYDQVNLEGMGDVFVVSTSTFRRWRSQRRGARGRWRASKGSARLRRLPAEGGWHAHLPWKPCWTCARP